MEDNRNSIYRISKKIAPTVAAAIFALAGCAKDNIIPPLELPKKPLSSSIKCEPLTEPEKAACLSQGKEARNVCRKVQKNKVICDDQQKFVDRLYDARNGK